MVNASTAELDADIPTDGGFDTSDERTLVEELMTEALGPGERSLISMRFGLSCDHALTLAEISGRLGISRERVRQIEQKSLSKLRLAAAR